MAETPAAPLEKAVEAYRRALDKVHHFDRQGDSGICGDESHVAGEALLAALDADPWQTARLEAEAALSEIRDSPTAMGKDIARRYFAERGER